VRNPSIRDMVTPRRKRSHYVPFNQKPSNRQCKPEQVAVLIIVKSRLSCQKYRYVCLIDKFREDILKERSQVK